MSAETIVIAGAGPVGLTAALGLAKAGHRVEVFEAEPHLSRDPRASTIHPPSLEAWAQWGVADDIVAQGVRVDRLQYWERSTKQLVAEFDYRLIADDTPFPFRLQCPQHKVIPILARAIDATPHGRVSFNHRVLGFVDHGDRVDVAVQTQAGERTVSARTFIGADGANSIVRRTLGLSFEGKTYEDRFLLVPTSFERSELGFAGLGPVAYMFDPKQWVITMQVPGALRIVFRLRDDEDPDAALQPQAIAARVEALLGQAPPPCPIEPSVYRVHQRVAETFRVGHVVLAGDAAHINNPAGGMGMNSGVHDAAALVGALLDSFGGDGTALDRYADTRRTVAVQRVQAHTDRHYGELGTDDEQARLERNASYASAAADPVLARRWLLKRAMLEERA